MKCQTPFSKHGTEAFIHNRVLDLYYDDAPLTKADVISVESTEAERLIQREIGAREEAHLIKKLRKKALYR